MASSSDVLGSLNLTAGGAEVAELLVSTTRMGFVSFDDQTGVEGFGNDAYETNSPLGRQACFCDGCTKTNEAFVPEFKVH